MVVSMIALIPGSLVKIDLALYDVGQLLKDQKAHIWSVSNLRNIVAKTLVGYETINGQWTKVNYYSDSKRTKLINTINETYWGG